MSPFTPVRMLLLGLFSWALLGAGIYFGYEAYNAFNQPAYPSTVALPNSINTDRIDADRVVDEPIQTVPDYGRAEWWPWTAAGLAALCLLMTVGGRLPVRAVFSLGGNAQANSQRPAAPPSETFCLERPCGSRLYGEIYGVDSGSTLVLTHGWSLDSTTWKYLLPALAAHHRVVVWDLAGLGRSQAPTNQDYSLEKMSHDLAAIINEACPKAPVILIGHSIGGMITQTFCRTHAENLGDTVKGIVLVHTTYTNPLKTNIAAALTKPLEPLIALLNSSMIPMAALYWLSNWQSYWNGSLHLAARFESFSGKQTWEQLDTSAWKGAVAWPAIVARGNAAMLKFDEQQTLPNVSVPVLVISGSNDLLTIPSASHHIAALLPHDLPFDDDGGHLGHVENNRQVSEVITEFVASVDSKASAIRATHLPFERADASNT